MSKNTKSYDEELNSLRYEVEYYRQEIRKLRLENARLEDYRLEVELCRQEIKKLRLENARLGELVDARFTEHDWLEPVGTE